MKDLLNKALAGASFPGQNGPHAEHWRLGRRELEATIDRVQVTYEALKEADDLKEALKVKEDLECMKDSLRRMAKTASKAIFTPSEELDIIQGELNQAKIDKGVAVAMHRMAKDEVTKLKEQLAANAVEQPR